MFKKWLTIILIIAAAFTISGITQAQTATPTGGPPSQIVMADSWQVTDAASGDASDPSLSLFLTLDDGDTLIQVERGADLIFNRNDDGTYSGAPLIPTDAYEYEANLTRTDEDTMQLDSTTTSGSFSSHRNLLFTRTDTEYTLWTETERNVTEYSMFQECIGRSDVTPGAVWTTPDLLVPIRIDEETGTLYIGSDAYTGGGGTYQREQTKPFGTSTQVITEIVTVTSENIIKFDYHAIADDRDDCQMIYNATLVPFDGDYDALLAAAHTLGEATP